MTAIDGEMSPPAFSLLRDDVAVESLLNTGSENEKHPAEFAVFPGLRFDEKAQLNKPFAEQSEYFDSDESALNWAPVFIAAIVLSVVAFLLGYYWRGGRLRHTLPAVAATARPSQISSGYSSGAPNSVTLPSPVRDAIPPILPVDTSGFVLQVGAMDKEGNADALSTELRKKNFSAFVFHRGADHFYRVAVGPYTEERAANQIKHDLEQEGYRPILRRWTPE